MEKLSEVVDAICSEKNLKHEEVRDALMLSIEKTANRIYGEDLNFKVEIDDSLKNINLFRNITVVESGISKDNATSVEIDQAKKIDQNIKIDDEIRYKISLEDLGRTGVSILYREFEYNIQKLVGKNIFEKYKNRVGELIYGVVSRVHNDNTYIEIGEITMVLFKKNRIKGEEFKVGDTVKCIIKKVFIDASQEIIIEVSRTSPKFLERLIELETPEVKDKNVLIHKSARIPGVRAKVALISLKPNIDPAGAVAGVRGVRINAVSKELNNEEIDCIEHSPIAEVFITRALSPAILTNIKINGRKAIVQLPQDQKAKAIGKNGTNVRLASMLTNYEIEFLDTTEEIPTISSKGKQKEDSLNNPLEDLFKG